MSSMSKSQQKEALLTIIHVGLASGALIVGLLSKINAVNICIMIFLMLQCLVLFIQVGLRYSDHKNLNSSEARTLLFYELGALTYTVVITYLFSLTI